MQRCRPQLAKPPTWCVFSMCHSSWTIGGIWIVEAAIMTTDETLKQWQVTIRLPVRAGAKPCMWASRWLPLRGGCMARTQRCMPTRLLRAWCLKCLRRSSVFVALQNEIGCALPPRRFSCKRWCAERTLSTTRASRRAPAIVARQCVAAEYRWQIATRHHALRRASLRRASSVYPPHANSIARCRQALLEL